MMKFSLQLYKQYILYITNINLLMVLAHNIEKKKSVYLDTFFFQAAGTCGFLHLCSCRLILDA